MSEVKSARELAHEFIEFNSYESIEYGYPILNNGAEEDLEITIKADRRAIIWECKQALLRIGTGNVFSISPSIIIDVLNSVLSEIEK